MKQKHNVSKELLEVIFLFENLKKDNIELYNNIRIFLEVNNIIKKTEIKKN